MTDHPGREALRRMVGTADNERALGRDAPDDWLRVDIRYCDARSLAAYVAELEAHRDFYRNSLNHRDFNCPTQCIDTGKLPVDGCCPVHGGDNCLSAIDTNTRTTIDELTQRIAELESQLHDARRLLDHFHPVDFKLCDDVKAWLARTAPKPKEADHG